jgi:hypothetical protein
MKEMLFILGAMLAIILFFAVVIKVTDKVVEHYYTKQDAKRRREHPELFRLFDECREKSDESIRWYNNEIAPRKREVDAILKTIDYLPKKQRAQEEDRLEEIRDRIYLAKITRKVLEEELEEIKNKIRKYVVDNNVEWAKKQGW